MDTEEATRHRSAEKANKKTKPELLKLLDDIIRSNSPHAAAYKMMQDVEKEVVAEALAVAGLESVTEPEVRDVRLVFRYVISGFILIFTEHKML